MKKIICILVLTLLVFSSIASALAETAQPKRFKIGDVNGDDVIDANDYILAKRAFFGLSTLDARGLNRVDVDQNGTFNADDYIKLKRAYFGMFNIPDILEPELPTENSSEAPVESNKPELPSEKPPMESTSTEDSSEEVSEPTSSEDISSKVEPSAPESSNPDADKPIYGNDGYYNEVIKP